MKKTFRSLAFLALLLLAAGCIPNLPGPSLAPTLNENAVSTAAAGTVEAMSTSAAVNTLIAQVTEMSKPTATATFTAVPTETPLPTATDIPTSTPIPTLTMTPTATNTPTSVASPTPPPTSLPTATRTRAVPSSTPVNTLIPQRATATTIPCYWAQYISDVTVPDGTRFNPGDTFVKTWRLRNIGSCAWTTDFELIYFSGDILSAPAAVPINANVKAGGYIDVSVTMKTPKEKGEYTGYWRMRSDNGVVFGIGADANRSFYVNILVGAAPTAEPGSALNLASSYCNAAWSSTKVSELDCPSAPSTNGSVTRVNTPKLEGGYQDDEPAVVMQPSSGAAGSITGRYPVITVKTGYHFTAVIGCMDASPKCNVMMQLNYSVSGGAVKNLDTWTQVSDGKFESINVDLSSLNGKKVQLILVVLSNGDSTDDRAFWLAPKVRTK